ncbi:MAG: hypothetical protein JNK22_18710, partial [Rhodocyclaceae bacterium]|nr:hypothetical protein [Rhodocyclaceae bacterium]
ALADLTLGPGHYTPLKGSPDGNTWASIDNPPGYSGREDFYALLNQVAGSDAYGFLGGAVTLAPATRDAVKAARDDFAAFAVPDSGSFTRGAIDDPLYGGIGNQGRGLGDDALAATGEGIAGEHQRRPHADWKPNSGNDTAWRRAA